MKYYAACGSNKDVEASIVTNPKRVLLSYFYYKNKLDYVKNLINQGIDVFLDSGAFSAKTKNKTININEYCLFIQQSNVKTYAGLDVIGNAEETFANQIYMEKEYNLHPIPTFHIGSNLEQLKKILPYNYIALGGLVHCEGMLPYLEEIWKILYMDNPQRKVHGFGLTNIEIVKKYPWYSVDSSSFKSCKRFGRQNLYDGNNTFKTISEKEFITLLNEKYLYSKEILENNQNRYYLEDLFAVNSMKNYIDSVTEYQKNKDFSFLTKQQVLL